MRGARNAVTCPTNCSICTEAAVATGFRRLGLTGTRWLVDSEVYPHALAARGLDLVRPDGAERDMNDRITLEELVCGVFNPDPPAND